MSQMICPSCGFDNIPGSDECAECMTSLMHEDIPPEDARDVIEKALMEGTVADLAPAEPISIEQGAGLDQAVERMRSASIGCLLVTDADGHLSGILTEYDLLHRIALEVPDLSKARVAEFMTPSPETIEPDRPLAHALHRMTVSDLRHLPLVDADGHCVGVFSARDVIHHLAGLVGIR